MTRRDFLGSGLAMGVGLSLPVSLGAPKAKMVRVASDRFDLVIPRQPRLRILQIADTHFGAPTPTERAKDRRTYALIRELIETHRPDYLFHTGDYINNDKENVEFGALDFMNGLDLPWSLVFGNHDHPDDGPGQKSLADYYASLGKASMGYADLPSGREYCYRVDMRVGRGKPFASLVAFNTGFGGTGMKVSSAQAAWFQAQLADDRKKEVTCPILAMQHVPTVEYRDVYAQHLAIGRQGEGVCFEQDNGEIFAQYVESGRVRAVFCGHDHVNDYVGELKNLRLVYGRCTGYSGYGDWERGARIIDIDPKTGRGHTQVVLGKTANEKPEWSETLKGSDLS